MNHLKSEVIKAYARIRTIDQTIPDEVLDLMKQAALDQIDRMEKLEEDKWFNSKDGVWPSLSELNFFFSNNQRTLTITHKDGQRIGIVFPEFLTKSAATFEPALQLLRQCSMIIAQHDPSNPVLEEIKNIHI